MQMDLREIIFLSYLNLIPPAIQSCIHKLECKALMPLFSRQPQILLLNGAFFLLPG